MRAVKLERYHITKAILELSPVVGGALLTYADMHQRVMARYPGQDYSLTSLKHGVNELVECKMMREVRVGCKKYFHFIDYYRKEPRIPQQVKVAPIKKIGAIQQTKDI